MFTLFANTYASLFFQIGLCLLYAASQQKALRNLLGLGSREYRFAVNFAGPVAFYGSIVESFKSRRTLILFAIAVATYSGLAVLFKLYVTAVTVPVLMLGYCLYTYHACALKARVAAL